LVTSSSPLSSSEYASTSFWPRGHLLAWWYGIALGQHLLRGFPDWVQMRVWGGSRRSTVLLLAMLVASTVILSAELSQFNAELLTWNLGGSQPGNPQSSEPSSQLGAVFVVANSIGPVAAVSGTGPAEVQNLTVPIVRLPVVIAKEGQEIIRQVVLYTNASGELFERLSPGNYSISAGDARFQFDSTFVSIGGLTTELAINVTAASHHAAFFELENTDGSGTVESWERVAVMVPSGTNYGLNESLYLQLTGPSAGQEAGITTVVQSLVISSYHGENDIWLVLKPMTALKALEYDFCSVIAYETEVAVSYHGG